MSVQPTPRLVLVYLGEKVFHRCWPEDDQRPACRTSRIRGVPMMRVFAERDGLDACPDCWPSADTGPVD
ncbi:MAG TPA: hypothetical protein VLB85_08875 [Acidimicrobiia bacterium]|nr:hypothetical protein [Acidimicrobiia bacterium]